MNRRKRRERRGPGDWRSRIEPRIALRPRVATKTEGNHKVHKGHEDGRRQKPRMKPSAAEPQPNRNEPRRAQRARRRQKAEATRPPLRGGARHGFSRIKCKERKAVVACWVGEFAQAAKKWDVCISDKTRMKEENAHAEADHPPGADGARAQGRGLMGFWGNRLGSGHV